MKVLFVPNPAGGPAHFIPLVALSRLLPRDRFESAFLLPAPLRRIAPRFGVRVLDVDQAVDFAMRTEMRAYKLFKPDVVVDDFSFSVGFSTELMNLPRVTIQRTGSFPGGVPRNPRQRHSGMHIAIKDIPDVTFLGLRQPQALSDLFDAECKIVPGIPSIEVLPPGLADRPDYFFSGPLLLEDHLFAGAGSGSPSTEPGKDFGSVRDFLDGHAGKRRRIFVTLGTVAEPGPRLKKAIAQLLSLDMAVISTVPIQDLSAAQAPLFHHAPHLPLHTVCSAIDLMIHQCGSGTYHYPVLHGVPTLTVGTGCHDREDVALRLQELGVSVHLPGPDERDDFEVLFRDAVVAYFANDMELLRAAKARLPALQDELRNTSAAFDMQGVLKAAVSRTRDARTQNKARVK